MGAIDENDEYLRNNNRTIHQVLVGPGYQKMAVDLLVDDDNCYSEHLEQVDDLEIGRQIPNDDVQRSVPSS